MSKLYQHGYPKGTFPILDEMNNNKHNWFSHEHNLIVFDISFVPGSGATCVYFLVDEDSEEAFRLIQIENEYVAKTYDFNLGNQVVFFERTDNPNPTQKLKIYLREFKLKRNLVGTVKIYK
jgi:hypothetical protein